MLHKFSVTNYQSIRDSVTLDFRVPKTTPKKSWFRSPSSQSPVRVPTVIVFIGPNGAGKTAWLRALADTIRFLINSYSYPPGPIPLFPAFASDKYLDKPTRIEVDFDAPWFITNTEPSNRMFRYILELSRGKPNFLPDAVGYEALYDFPQGRRRRLMERRGNNQVYLAKDMSIKPSDDRLASVPDNASVISTLSRMGVEEFVTIIDSLSRVMMNVSSLDPIRLDTETVTHYFRDNPQVKELISGKLMRFDLGIEGMNVQQWADGKWRLSFAHSGLDRDIFLESESAGTRHVVHIFPTLNFSLGTGGLAVMDALDNELHTDLVEEILGWFRRKDTNPYNAQLICSLHNLSVLDNIEKEEIIIVEKTRTGITQAYGVRDIEGVRRSSNLRKLYRSGALGGLPTFG